MRLHSGPGEPLRAELSVSDAETHSPDIVAELVSSDGYQAADLPYPPQMGNVDINVLRQEPGRWELQLRGSEPISVSPMHFLLRVRRGSATVVRDYQIDLTASTGAAALADQPRPKVLRVRCTREDLEESLQRWVRAWSARNLDGYFAAYGSNFVPAQGKSRAAWETERRQRIETKRFVNVSIDALKVDVKDCLANVRFRQFYRSDKGSETGWKTMQWRFKDDRWEIELERFEP